MGQSSSALAIAGSPQPRLSLEDISKICLFRYYHAAQRALEGTNCANCTGENLKAAIEDFGRREEERVRVKKSIYALVDQIRAEYGDNVGVGRAFCAAQEDGADLSGFDTRSHITTADLKKLERELKKELRKPHDPDASVQLAR